MDDLQKNLLTDLDLQMDNVAREQFNEAAKWSRFISLVMFIGGGLILLLVIIGFSAIGETVSKLGGSQFNFLSRLTGTVLIIMVLVVAFIIGITYYFLFNFSKKTKTALISESVTELNNGLQSLKLFFIISTVLSLLLLANNLYNILF